jgi:hypothetical protein
LLGQLFPEHEALYSVAGRKLIASPPTCTHENCALNLLGYSSKGSSKDIASLPTEALFGLDDFGWDGRKAVGFMRSSWSAGSNATWIAFKAGNGEANHNDLDAGSFVLEMGGQEWAIDLGADSYGLKDYFDKSAAHGKRYSYYRKATAGHNTLTFNNDEDLQVGWCDQSMAASEVSYFSPATADRGAYAVVNLTAAYAKQGGPAPPLPHAGLVMRGFAFSADYLTLYIVDEFDFEAAANVTWALHTRAVVEVKHATSKQATSTAEAGGAGGAYAHAELRRGVGLQELLLMDVLEPTVHGAAHPLGAAATDGGDEPAPAVLSSGPCPHFAPQESNEGVNKIRIVAQPARTSRIVVRLSRTPLEGAAPVINALSEWSAQSPFGDAGGGGH